MSRRAAPLAVVVALLVVPGVAVAKPCPGAGRAADGTTVHIVRGEQATLVNTYNDESGGLSVDSAVCDRRDGRLYPPSWTLPYDDFWRIDRDLTALAGRYIAYIYNEQEGLEAFIGVEVIDVRAPATFPIESVDSDGDVAFRKVALRPTGTVAWATTGGVFVAALSPRGERPTVRRIGRPVRLEALSLRATPRGFCWRARGKQRCERVR